MLEAFPLKGSFDGDGGVRGRDKTETAMEQGMWVYMAAVVGAGLKINKSDSLYLSA